MNIFLIILWMVNILGYAIGLMTPNVVSSIILSTCLLIYAVRDIDK